MFNHTNFPLYKFEAKLNLKIWVGKKDLSAKQNWLAKEIEDWIFLQHQKGVDKKNCS